MRSRAMAAVPMTRSTTAIPKPRRFRLALRALMLGFVFSLIKDKW
jgi:hypothetical protein